MKKHNPLECIRAKKLVAIFLDKKEKMRQRPSKIGGISYKMQADCQMKDCRAKIVAFRAFSEEK